MTAEEEVLKKLRSEISSIIKEEIKKSQDEIIEKLSEKINPLLEEYDMTPPYERLSEWSHNAMSQIKKDITKAIEENNPKEEKEARDKAEQIDKMIDDVINLIEKIRKDELKGKELTNPLYPRKKIHRIPLIARFRGHGRGTRNWLGLLLTGTGLAILGSGVWGAAGELFSVQGSIILGLIILLLTAWLARRRVFALFGQE